MSSPTPWTLEASGTGPEGEGSHYTGKITDAYGTIIQQFAGPQGMLDNWTLIVTAVNEIEVLRNARNTLEEAWEDGDTHAVGDFLYSTQVPAEAAT